MCDNKIKYHTKDLPRTRDQNGKYIPGSNSHYVKMEPQKDIYLRDGKFHSRQVQSEWEKEASHSLKSKEEIEERKKQRNGRGYDPFKFTLSAPFNGNQYICLPEEWSYKAIHVEDVYIQTNQLTFRDALMCCTEDKPALNEIWFTEGALVDCEEIKLPIGKCIFKTKTFMCIEYIEYLDAYQDGFKHLKITVPCHNVGKLCKTIYLLENLKFVPNEIQYWPFIVEDILDADTLLVAPKKNGCKFVIPNTFCPDTMLTLPPLKEVEIAQFVQECIPDICIKWDCNCKEYQVEIKCPERTIKIPKLLPKENEFFLARISPKRYEHAYELYPEIQRAMNPPLVTSNNQNITINGVLVQATIREYMDAHEFAEELQNKINMTLGWNGIFQELCITYNEDAGRFIFKRFAPFEMQFGCQSLINLLGFSDYSFVGNQQYISNYQVYYVSVNRSCLQFIPSNRYIASYDKINDLISIRAVSKADYMKFMIPGYIPDEFYKFCHGNNFVLPFTFVCGSPFTEYLSFMEKGCFMEWISAIGVTRLLGPPPILYLVIPELENDIFIANDACLLQLFSSAMAILYLEPNGKTYKSKATACQNGLTWNRNVYKESICKLTLQFYTENGIQYCMIDSRGVINLCMSV